MTVKNTAYMIEPVQITDAMVVSCTVPDVSNDEVAWVAEEVYAIGEIVARPTAHKRYKRLSDGASTAPPESDSANWLDIGPTNRWGQFDRKIGTKTSTSANSLTTVLSNLGSIEGLCLMDVFGQQVEVTMCETVGGQVVLPTRVIDLDASVVESVYDWMYGEYIQRETVVMIDLPGQYPSAEITVTVRGSSGVAVGVLAIGRVYGLGATEQSDQTGSGITNFGKVLDDGFGNRDWIDGEWSDRVTLPLINNTVNFSRLKRHLAKLRSKPCVYIGSMLPEYEALVCYGVYRDLYITAPYKKRIKLALEIDGLNNI